MDELIAAMRQGDTARVEALLTENPSLLQQRTKEGASIVALACYLQHPEIARILVERGASLDLFDACTVGDEARVRECIAEAPDSINSYAADGFYPLGLAAFFGHRSIVAYLLEHGADVNQVAKNALQVAPIHAAVSNGDIETVRMLLDHGADVNARQQAGFTPLQGALGAGRKELAELLLARGAAAA